MNEGIRGYLSLYLLFGDRLQDFYCTDLIVKNVRSLEDLSATTMALIGKMEPANGVVKPQSTFHHRACG
jgi:hypothetical protein